MENIKVLVLGGGKIGQAVAFYLNKNKAISEIALFSDSITQTAGAGKIKIIKGDVLDGEKTKIIEKYDILIGALPEKFGRQSLKLALKYKKDLIDVSVVSNSFYLKHLQDIDKAGIRVVPGCGISPGLVNLICGFEIQNFKKDDKVEIGAGTLPLNKNFFFPFTWSFQDLIEEHLEKAIIIKNGKEIKLLPFSGYRKENFKEIGDFESYFIEEWSSLQNNFGLKNIDFRVIRPVGFSHFFQYLKNYYFFEKRNLNFTKKLLTQEQADNLTLIYVKIADKNKEVFWRAFSCAKKKEKLNSMQKFTALVPAAILNLILEGKIKKSGLIFMEEIGRQENLFKEIIGELEKNGIAVKKTKEKR